MDRNFNNRLDGRLTSNTRQRIKDAYTTQQPQQQSIFQQLQESIKPPQPQPQPQSMMQHNDFSLIDTTLVMLGLFAWTSVLSDQFQYFTSKIFTTITSKNVYLIEAVLITSLIIYKKDKNQRLSEYVKDTIRNALDI
jgi:hypothetical protein